MGSEGFIVEVSAIALWAIVGVVAALVIKTIWRLERLPGWPIFWCMVVGSAATMMLNVRAFSG